MTYNINAARALRNEATGETWDIELDGATYHLHREPPMELVDRIAELEATPGVAGIRTIIEILLGDEAASFPFGKLSIQDTLALFQQYKEEVSVGLGESQGSSPSSTSTPAPSKPTSKPRTASASRKSTKARSAGGASKS